MSNTNVKVVLFDADGVLTVPEELFSTIYAKSHGLNTQPFERFFKEFFPAALVGKADLKELIHQHPEVWRQGTADTILKEWFEVEDIRNEEALEIVRQLKQSGIKCYLATNQEKYRGAYMKDVMFKGLFEDYFISAEMGVKKPSPEFFGAVLAKVREDIPELMPEDITFFDDTPDHVVGARTIGINAHLYKDVSQLISLL